MIRPLLSLEHLSLDVREGQVTVRYYGLYANAHRGKVKKASLGPFPLRMVEDLRLPLNILRDSPLDRQERSVGMPIPFSLSAAGRPLSPGFSSI